MKKFLCYLKTDGYTNTCKYFFNVLKEKFFIRKTYTFFYEYRIKNKFEIDIPKNLDMLIVKEYETLRKYKYCKLSELNCREWFENGSTCCLCIINRKVVSYIWAHKKHYNLKNLGIFILGKNELWIGTSFCDKKYRRMGINTVQRKYLINYLFDRDEIVLFGSANLSNIASLANLINFGYEIIGILYLKKYFRTWYNISCAGTLLDERIRKIE